jgi:hypothetical protein
VTKSGLSRSVENILELDSSHHRFPHIHGNSFKARARMFFLLQGESLIVQKFQLPYDSDNDNNDGADDNKNIIIMTIIIIKI